MTAVAIDAHHGPGRAAGSGALARGRAATEQVVISSMFSAR